MHLFPAVLIMSVRYKFNMMQKKSKQTTQETCNQNSITACTWQPESNCKETVDTYLDMNPVIKDAWIKNGYKPDKTK